MAKQDHAIVPSERIKNAMYLIRSENITLDLDLASPYGVTTGSLVEASSKTPTAFQENSRSSYRTRNSQT